MKQVTVWLRMSCFIALLAVMTGALSACQSVRGSETVVYYSADDNWFVNAELLRGYLMGESTLSEAQKAKADMDKDGKITAKDLYLWVKENSPIPGKPSIGPL